VAVGNNNSTWYSTDGSDWTLAQVQPPAAEFLESQGFTTPEWGMDGLAVAGDKLVAWGNAFQSDGVRELQIGLWWTSRDGRSWSNVPYPLGASDNIGLAGGNIGLAAGPRGFVGVFEEGGQLVFRASADGSTWEQVHSLGAARSTGADGTEFALSVSSIAASDAGFVAVGGFGEFCLFTCAPGEIVIWTSEDGRSWSRLPSDARFARAGVSEVVAWGDRFVVGGTQDGEPAIWISHGLP
jgi:hypothetical protein